MNSHWTILWFFLGSNVTEIVLGCYGVASGRVCYQQGNPFNLPMIVKVFFVLCWDQSATLDILRNVVNFLFIGWWWAGGRDDQHSPGDSSSPKWFVASGPLHSVHSAHAVHCLKGLHQERVHCLLEQDKQTSLCQKWHQVLVAIRQK